MIPKILYTAWVSDLPLPTRHQYIESWRRVMPDYEIRVLGNDDVPDTPCTREMAARGKFVTVAQYAAFAAMYETGGIYMDLDVDVLRTFDDLLSDGAFIGVETERTTCVLNCAVVGCEAGHPLMTEVLARMDGADYDQPAVENELGPWTFTRLVQARGWDGTDADTLVGDVHVCGSKAFYPYPWYEPYRPECVTPATYAVHRWASSWVENYVSIVIPCYNHGEYLAQSIESALAQTHSLRLACQHSGVSDPFVLMNDDFYVMRPVTTVPALNFGPIRSVIEEYAGRGVKSSVYMRDMARTRAVLERSGVPEPVSYELHVPMTLRKDPLLGILSRYCLGAGEIGIQFRTLYGNIVGERGRRSRDVKVYGAGEPLPRGDWLSSNDGAFDAVRAALQRAFPDPCRHEAGDSDRNIRSTSSKGSHPMARTVTTTKRLYDTDTSGRDFLVYPVGSEVPEDEYARLTGHKAPSAEEPVAKPLKRMNHSELMTEAVRLGVEVAPDATKAVVLAAIEGASA